MADFDSLNDLLDGLDNEISNLSNQQAESFVGGGHSAQPAFSSSESAISESFFNLPDLPFKAQANRDQLDDEDGNLSFVESEIIEVTAVDDASGLFRGEMPGGRKGWFPRTFVTVLGMKEAPFVPEPELSFDPATSGFDMGTEEDFSTLSFEVPADGTFANPDFSNLQGTASGFGVQALGDPSNFQFADVGEVPDFTVPPSDADLAVPAGGFSSTQTDYFAPAGLGGDGDFTTPEIDLSVPVNAGELGPVPDFTSEIDSGSSSFGGAPVFEESQTNVIVNEECDTVGDTSAMGDYADFTPPVLSSRGPPSSSELGALPPREAPSFTELGAPPEDFPSREAPSFAELGAPPEVQMENDPLEETQVMPQETRDEDASEELEDMGNSEPTDIVPSESPARSSPNTTAVSSGQLSSDSHLAPPIPDHMKKSPRTCPSALSFEISYSPAAVDDLPSLPECPPVEFIYTPQNSSQRKEQEKTKRAHEKELSSKDHAAQSVQNKKAASHKSALVSLEKQHDKESATQKKEEADRPSKLNSHHITEQRLLVKELENDSKARVTAHKKAMKQWQSEQQTELKNLIKALSSQYKKEKNMLKQKKTEAETEAKVRQPQYIEKETLKMECDLQSSKAKKEADLRSTQMKAVHELETQLQVSRQRVERRHRQESHRHHQRELKENHEDEMEALSIRHPIVEKHLQDMIELDLVMLSKQQEIEIAEMGQQIQNSQKIDRKEYLNKKKLQEKEHQNTLKQLKKGKDKNAIAQEKAKFQKEQEEQDHDFELSQKDEVVKKTNEFRNLHDEQKQQMKDVHKETEEILRIYHDLLRRHTERNYNLARNKMLDDQRKECTEIFDSHFKQATALLKRHHEQLRTMTKEQHEQRRSLLSKRGTDLKALYVKLLGQFQQNSIVVTPQDTKEREDFDRSFQSETESLASELASLWKQMEEQLERESSDLKDQLETDRQSLN
mmetsp:Transcript_16/g.31  ORF Transcript_16/g.31 Transcript_16/m.31 type:complete len:958 (+) Transcript_16:29-2902(+)|eukprot:CAMPEP_0201491464 /NCGR_PEP_ID=MMETSP0151_2-20130828/29926_1 /ASSEMBLY_ACC=CAM_ASM_000257 /TAXON_ID=200890 /ORGANISM="Paramoeba atlantica, Strain 621/1 / CCAP 1560/9" /LENGTH=957 /DNA_ID=CAMNT_0047877831 /DNA_START=27 /DNA_END=2900 /DNA_ORIENTATION=-